MGGSRYFDELTRIQERLNALLDRVMRSSETEDGFRVYAELPGVRRADIDLTLRERRLELSGLRRPDSAAEFRSGVLAISLTKGRPRHLVTRIAVAEEAE